MNRKEHEGREAEEIIGLAVTGARDEVIAQGKGGNLSGRGSELPCSPDVPMSRFPDVTIEDVPILNVVQKHRRLRPIAPARAGAETTASACVPQPNWTAAIQAVFAAWLPSSSHVDVVVASAEKNGTRASQTARTSLGRKSRLLCNCRRGQNGKAYRLRLLELLGTGKCIISYLPAPQETAQGRRGDRSMA